MRRRCTADNSNRATRRGRALHASTQPAAMTRPAQDSTAAVYYEVVLVPSPTPDTTVVAADSTKTNESTTPLTTHSSAATRTALEPLATCHLD